LDITTVKKSGTDKNKEEQGYHIQGCKKKDRVQGAHRSKGSGFHTYRVIGFSKWIAGGFSFLPLRGIERIKILAKLVLCKSTNTQLKNGQKTTDPGKNYY
jgi:hypothetical protein